MRSMRSKSTRETTLGFYLKFHGDTLALCDQELLGEVIEEKGLVLNISRQFYEDRVVEEQEAVQMIKKSRNGVVTGNRAVKLALGNNLLKEYNTVNNTMYAVYTRID